MFPDLEFIKTCLNGLRNRIEKVENWVVSFVRTNRPNWVQNDPDALDYVKNRPFYTGNPVETVLVEESIVPFEVNGRFYAAHVPSTFLATVGETYKVHWDGATYECICAIFDGSPFLGNLSIPGAGSDTGEPFVLSSDGKTMFIYTADTSAYHTISISGFAEDVVKIDEKYLPHMNVSAFTNDAGYLTLATLPMYGGENE